MWSLQGTAVGVLLVVTIYRGWRTLPVVLMLTYGLVSVQLRLLGDQGGWQSALDSSFLMILIVMVLVGRKRR